MYREELKPSTEVALSAPASGVGSIHWLETPAAHSAEQTATLVVGDAYNRHLQLFSVQADGGLQQEHSLQLESKDGEAGLCNAIAVQPEAQLVVLANMERKAVYVLHVLLSEGARFDYLTKYQLGFPILSMEAERELSNGVARLFCVQTHAIQAYNLQLADCKPQPKDLAAPQQLVQSLGADAQPETSSAAPVSSDVMPSHMLADSEEEESTSRPQSAGSAAAARSPDLDVGLPRPPPPVTTPPAAAVPQPRLLTPKQLKQLAGSRAGSLGSAASAEVGAARDGQPSSGQPFGLQRAPTPPAKPPSPALSGAPATFGERPSISEGVPPPASSLPMFGGTIAGGEPVAASQAPEPPSPALNGTATPPMKILKRKKDGDTSSAQPESEVWTGLPRALTSPYPRVGLHHVLGACSILPANGTPRTPCITCARLHYTQRRQVTLMLVTLCTQQPASSTDSAARVSATQTSIDITIRLSFQEKRIGRCPFNQ